MVDWHMPETLSPPHFRHPRNRLPNAERGIGRAALSLFPNPPQAEQPRTSLQNAIPIDFFKMRPVVSDQNETPLVSAICQCNCAGNGYAHTRENGRWLKWNRYLRNIDKDLDGSVERLFDLLRIESISTDPAYRKNCADAANWLVNDLKSIGFSAKAVKTPGPSHGGCPTPQSQGRADRTVLRPL